MHTLVMTAEELAVECAQAAVVALQAFGTLEPIIAKAQHQLLTRQEQQHIQTFSQEMSVKLALLARTVSEQPALEHANWRQDSRIVLPILYELSAAYLLFDVAAQNNDLDQLPPLTRNTLKRLTTKEVRAWINLHLGTSL